MGASLVLPPLLTNYLLSLPLQSIDCLSLRRVEFSPATALPCPQSIPALHICVFIPTQPPDQTRFTQSPDWITGCGIRVPPPQSTPLDIQCGSCGAENT